MDLYARHGDLVIEKRATPIDGDLTPARDLVLAGQDSGGVHTLRGASAQRRDGRTTLVRVPEPTTLEHAGRHKAIAIEAGDYEIRSLRERGDDGDRVVED